jgi:hypothetical protein
MKRRFGFCVTLAFVVGSACTKTPSERPVVGEDGFVTTTVTDETLSTQGLLPPYPACCPGTECCAPPYYCAYFDTADASLGDAGANINPLTGLRLQGSSPKPGVGAACKNQNVAAFPSPVVISTLLSYDRSMDYGQWIWESGGWIVYEANKGLRDFVSNGTLSNGLIGLAARQPLWEDPWWCGWANPQCPTECDASKYEAAASPGYTLAGQGNAMMNSWLPQPYTADSFTAMGGGNPVTLGWRAARKRALEYWATNKVSTPFIVITVADYPEACGDSPNTLASEVYGAAFQPSSTEPVIPTMVIGFNLDSYQRSYYSEVRRNGWGASSYQGNSNARVDMKNAMTFMRQQAATGAFYINPPANGEEIDDTSFKFYLKPDNNPEILVPNAGAQAGCGSSAQGYWLTRPEGPSGRIVFNLCPGTVAVAAAAYQLSARVVYDCVEQFPTSSTYTRDFDLTRCATSDTTKSRALRLDWDTALAGDTGVNFRMKFAPLRTDLATASVALTASALQWVPGSEDTFVDLTNATIATLPSNYQWARLEMELLASVDRRRSPTVNNWKLTFTCTDGN